MSHSFGVLGSETIFSYHKVDIKRLYRSLMDNKQLLNKTALQIFSELIRFKHSAKQDMAEYGSMNLKAYLEFREYSHEFIYCYMYPALATICTCSYANLDSYPVSVIVDFLENMVGTFNLRRVKGGTSTIISRLVETIQNIRCNSIVTSVRQVNDNFVTVRTASDSEQYDHVIVATEPNQAIKLLGDNFPQEAETLQLFRYDTVTVTVHQDIRFMPAKQSDWAMINFMTSPKHDSAMSTIWMNRLEQQWQDKTPVFQTIGPLMETPPDRLISQTDFQRSVVDEASQRGLAELSQLNQQPNRRLWLCGSYASQGIPLLESGVCSSVAIATELGVACPWDYHS
jgi:predicted NAD/FAD-binding protein